MKNLKSIFGLLSVILFAGAMSLAFGGAIAFAIDEPQFTYPVAGVILAASMLYTPEKGSLCIVFTKGICEKIQTSLIQIFGANAPSIKRSVVGYLQAIMSPMNSAGMSVIPIDPGNGKIKKVKIKFIKRGIASDITDTETTGCGTDLEKEPFEQDVEITNYIGTKDMKFTEAEMRKLCEGDQEFMAAIISAEIDPLTVELDKALIALQATNFGNFNPDISPATYKEVALLKDGDSKPNYFGESQIMEVVENLDSTARPIVIGSGKLGHYARMVGIGCCNEAGLDLSKAGNLDYFRDRYVGDILGDADRFITLIPGYVQLLTWNKYVGPYKKENDVFSHGTMVDPITGLTFDMKWHYNDCDDYYTVRFGLWYELYFLPTDAFAAADELSGVNFTLQFQATQLNPDGYLGV